MRPGLIVVDVQRDFCPLGSLAVKDGDKVVPKLNQVIEAFDEAGLPIFFSRDWHPANHCSFNVRGGIWPPHCVRGTPGAEFHHDLKVPMGSTVVNKGTDPEVEAYSAFQGTDLADNLRKGGVDELFIGGLATDYCVKESALDALKEGFSVFILEDCVRGVNQKPDDSDKALKEMTARGARIITTSDAMKLSRAQQ